MKTDWDSTININSRQTSNCTNLPEATSVADSVVYRCYACVRPAPAGVMHAKIWLADFGAIYRDDVERWPGANTICCDCLCANQKLSVNAYTFTYYCWQLAIRMGIHETINVPRFRGSMECHDQALKEAEDPQFQPQIDVMIADAENKFDHEADAPMLRTILEATMCLAAFVKESTEKALFGTSETLWELREKVLKQNRDRAASCFDEVVETWRHFSELGGKELDDHLKDVSDAAAVEANREPFFVWRNDEQDPARRFSSVNEAYRHFHGKYEDDNIIPRKMQALFHNMTPTRKINATLENWEGREEWLRKTQWRASRNEDDLGDRSWVVASDEPSSGGAPDDGEGAAPAPAPPAKGKKRAAKPAKAPPQKKKKPAPKPAAKPAKKPASSAKPAARKPAARKRGGRK